MERPMAPKEDPVTNISREEGMPRRPGPRGEDRAGQEAGEVRREGLVQNLHWGVRGKEWRRQGRSLQCGIGWFE